MKQAFRLAGHCIGAVLFTAVGLGAYGCGDSATVNPVVELASLSVSPGTLQPGFSGGTTQYRVDVTTDITTVTITAQAAVAGDAVTIDGQRTTSRSVILDPPGSTTVINIVVSETDTNSRTYVIRVVRAGLAGNNSLESLTVSPGTLAPTFDENLQSYTASVDNNVGSVTVTSTLSDTAATMTVNGQATNSGQARTITLNAGGQSTTITIIVTAQNGNSKTYVVTVSRGRSNNNNLQSLGISPGTLSPSFRAGTTGYTVNLAATLANNPANVTVTPRLQDTAATMTVNGQTTTSGQARTTPLPAQGSNTFINIVVVAQDGTPKTYTVNVIRAALGGNNNLSGLTVSPGPLAPVFSAATTSYTVDVASTVASITVTPTRQDSNATITVNGQAATSGQAQTVTLRAAGLSTSIPIMVTAPNGSSKTYTITVDRAALGGNNNLSGLTVSPGPLAPVFSAATTSYTVDVASTVASI
ncbi:MAG: cadherin-like beta sandwich domain-containing protein, partial [Nitrospira sp.]|nr:cadherin-like beta sandwich domain-containing protein [Nitrospira sp.]